MNFYQKTFKNYTKAAICLGYLFFSLQMYAMSRAYHGLTLEQKHALIAKQAIIRKANTQNHGLTLEQKHALIFSKAIPKILYQKIKLIGHEGKVWHCSFSKNNQYIVTIAEGRNNNMILWEANTGKILKKFNVNTPLNKDDFVKINNDGSRIMLIHTEVIQENKELKKQAILTLWSNTDDLPIKTFKYTVEMDICQADFSSNSRTIIFNVCQNESSDIIIINSHDGAEITKHTAKGKAYFMINPKEDTFFINFDDNFLTLYNSNTGNIIALLSVNDQKIYNPEYNSNGTAIITSTGQNIIVWDGKTGISWNEKTAKRYSNFLIFSYIFALSPDQTKIAAYETYETDQPIISIYDTASHKKITTFQSTGITNLTFSPNNTTLASTSHAETTLWNSTTGKKLHSFNYKPFAKDIDVTFNTAGTIIKSIYSFTNDENIVEETFWSASSGKEIASITSDNNSPSATDSNFTTIVMSDKDNDHNLILSPINSSLTSQNPHIIKSTKPSAISSNPPTQPKITFPADQHKIEPLVPKTKPQTWTEWTRSWWQ